MTQVEKMLPKIIAISIFASSTFAIDCPPIDATATQAVDQVAPSSQAQDGNQATATGDATTGSSEGSMSVGSAGGLTYSKHKRDLKPKESCTPASAAGNYTNGNTTASNTTSAYGNTTYVGTNTTNKNGTGKPVSTNNIANNAARMENIVFKCVVVGAIAFLMV